MKRFLSSLMMLVMVVAAISAKTYVVSAGVANYKGQNQLSYPAQDATQFAALMKNAGSHVTLLTSRNATHDNVVAAIRRVAKVATDKDRIVFFFCGHGGPGELLTYDDPKLRNRTLSYAELIDELDKVPANQKVVFINSCHSGSAGDVVMDSDWQNSCANTNIVLFLSSDAKEYSIESNWTSAGFFTRAVLNCLHGLCDANGDKKITFREMGDYIYEDVVNRSHDAQHPQLFVGPGMLDKVFMKF